MSDNAAELFEYTDGGGTKRKGDPVELLRRLHNYCNGDYNEVMEQSESPLPEISIPAGERLATAVCHTFRLGQPWNEIEGTGVLESVWRPTLKAFLGTLEKNALMVEVEPILSPPSATESSDLAQSSSSSST